VMLSLPGQELVINQSSDHRVSVRTDKIVYSWLEGLKTVILFSA